jgi:CubicO group peptidase (beta-lactamase class C family)
MSLLLAMNSRRRAMRHRQEDIHMSTLWAARHGLTSAQYQAEFDKLVGAGYRLTDVNGYGVNDTAYYAAIFEKTAGPAWHARHGLTSAQYQATFDDLVKQGYRLTRVSGGTVDGQDRYAAIWTQTTGPAWVARHGLTSAQYQAEFDKRVAEGYRLVDISGYTVGSSPRFAALFVKTTGPAWQARHGLTSAEYQTAFNQLTQQGYRLVRVSGYTVDGQDRYAAIFVQQSGPGWVARHGMTSAQYQEEFDIRRYQGYRLKDVSGYEVAGQARYAAIWHSESMLDADLSLIDKKIQAYVTQHSVPGLSIAIAKNERLVYAEGYGFADTTTKERVTPKHLFRIASVSKPITAVAVMELVENGKLTLDQKVFGSSGILGTTYGTKSYSDEIEQITVRHLLQHTSGWSNDGGDPMFKDVSLTQAQLITWMLDNRPLKNEPGKTYEYLNFGYCLLGRIIEKVTGQQYEDHVRNGVLKQCGVTRMQIGGATAAERKPGEVAYYGNNPYGLLPRRMDAHGGWIATPIDLLRLMVRTDGFNAKTDILYASTETQMYSGSTANAGYGAGWIVSSSYRGHNGAMNGTIAFLVRRNDGFSFAVAANMRPGDDSYCFDLKAALDSIVTSVSKWPEYDLF